MTKSYWVSWRYNTWARRDDYRKPDIGLPRKCKPFVTSLLRYQPKSILSSAASAFNSLRMRRMMTRCGVGVHTYRNPQWCMLIFPIQLLVQEPIRLASRCISFLLTSNIRYSIGHTVFSEPFCRFFFSVQIWCEKTREVKHCRKCQYFLFRFQQVFQIPPGKLISGYWML